MMDSHELHIFYMDLHAESRGYKDAINEINIKRQSKGKTPLERRIVEMNNFQNPQVNILNNLVDLLYTDNYVLSSPAIALWYYFSLVSPVDLTDLSPCLFSGYESAMAASA